MEASLKIKALRKLAAIDNDQTKAALAKEVAKISTILETETRYDLLVDQLNLLDVISYRVHAEAITIVTSFLARVGDLDITYPEVWGYSKDALREYQNEKTLTVKVLEILEHFRYHEPEKILDIFFNFSVSPHEIIAKQAMHGLNEFTKLDLDIFWGDDKGWGGLRAQPQEKALEKIESFNDAEKHIYFEAILAVCKNVLSPTIEGSEWSSTKVVIKTGSIEAVDTVPQTRDKAIEILKSTYALAINLSEKKSVLSALNGATATPRSGRFSDKTAKMIVGNTLTVLSFFVSLIDSEDLQIVQKIEHKVYWIYFHRADDSIRKQCLEIKEKLDNHSEYQIFKVLIGFEGIFRDWEIKDPTEQNRQNRIKDDIEYEQSERERKTLEFADSVDTNNYTLWEKRILAYSDIESRDLATFPFFGKFLERIATRKPEIGLDLLIKHFAPKGRFTASVMIGIWKSPQQNKLISLLKEWVSKGSYLYEVARFFEFNEELDSALVQNILVKAIASKDYDTVTQLISTLSAHYKSGHLELLKSIFIPALEFLTAREDNRWIFNFWFRKNRSEIIDDLDEHGCTLLLNNLLRLDELDYQAEEILNAIAQKQPLKVVEYFCQRIELEKTKNDGNKFEAIPYEFHRLSAPLSTIPEQLVDAVFATYDGNYGRFIFRGARLLSNVFPAYHKKFFDTLTSYVHSGNEQQILFVLGVLRSYEGQEFLHPVFKELVKALPEDSDLLVEVEVGIQSTGVISGEYGLAEAYEGRRKLMESWKEDSNERVRNFAVRYISQLNKQIEAERRRSKEQILLRKHQYGETDSDDV
jgi:hypothetical protein